MNIDNSYNNLQNHVTNTTPIVTKKLPISIISQSLTGNHDENYPRSNQMNILNVHKPDINGNSPLINAINDNPDYAKSLIAFGAHINYANPKLCYKFNDYDLRMNITPLSTAIINGNEELAILLINKGAFLGSNNCPKHLDSLECAMLCAQWKIAAAIINAKRDIDLNSVQENKKSYLEYAAENDQSEIFKLLIQAGADPYLVDNNQQPVFYDIFTFPNNVEITNILIELDALNYSRNSNNHNIIDILKAIKPENYTKIKNLIYEKLPELKLINKEISMRKKLAHFWEIEKHTTFQDFKGEEFSIRLLGYQSKRFSTFVRKSLYRFAFDYPKQLNYKRLNHLSNALQIASNQSYWSSEQYYNRIMKGQPTIIFSGPTEHSVTFLFQSDCFVICDRAEGQDPLRIYFYNRDLLSPELLEYLVNDSQSPTKFYRNLKKFVKAISGVSNILDKFINHHDSIGPQSTNNCSWASYEGILLAYFIIDEMDAQEKKLEKLDDDKFYEAFSKIFSDKISAFNLFSTYIKTIYFEKYIHYHCKEPRKYPPDLELIQDIMESPLSAPANKNQKVIIQERFITSCKYFQTFYKAS